MDRNNNENDNTIRHDRSHVAGDEIGEAAGGISGVVVGAAIGSLGGPVGTVIGGIAGAIGGWWAGHSVADAAQEYTVGDDAVYRNHYDNSPIRLADRDYESVSPAYRLGHLAARNPDYHGRPFHEVEPDLKRGWNGVASKTHGEWETVRGYANDAYDRSASSVEQQRLREEASNAADDDAKRLDDAGDVNLF
ncbi:MAG TPA: hypothetical protein VII66_06200 [Gemmatimonadaceae bacterium]